MSRDAHLSNNKTAGHAKAGFGSEVVGDHDTKPSLRKPVIWRTGADDLVHHDHRTSSVRFTRLDYTG